MITDIKKIYIRPNGDRILVSMSISQNLGIVTSVSLTQKKKRKSLWDTASCSFGDSVFGWKYRSASLDERRKMKKDFVMQYVTLEELNEVRDELFDKIKSNEFYF